MKLDLSDESWDDALPPEGAHSAVVARARVFMSNSGDRGFCELTFELATGHRVPVLLTIWVDEEQHDRTANLGEAKVLLGQLARATGIALPADGEDLPETYLGERVQVVIAHTFKRGLKTAVVKRVLAVKQECPDDEW